MRISIKDLKKNFYDFMHDFMDAGRNDEEPAGARA